MRLSWKFSVRSRGSTSSSHATFGLRLWCSWVFAGGPLSPLNILVVLSVFGCVLLHELGHAAHGPPLRNQHPRHHPLPNRWVGGGLERMPRAPGRRVVDRIFGRASRRLQCSPVLELLPPALPWAQARRGSCRFRAFSSRLCRASTTTLSLFNLIPRFPHGAACRVLVALLSGRLGRMQATVIAATAGKTLAVCFAVAVLLWTQNPDSDCTGSRNSSPLHAAQRRRSPGTILKSKADGDWLAPTRASGLLRPVTSLGPSGKWLLATGSHHGRQAFGDPDRTASPWGRRLRKFESLQRGRERNEIALIAGNARQSVGLAGLPGRAGRCPGSLAACLGDSREVLATQRQSPHPPAPACSDGRD